MHMHGIAHLDISLRNILTDFHGNYAFIDFETSRIYPEAARCKSNPQSTHQRRTSNGSKVKVDIGESDSKRPPPPRIQGIHGTEDPPEIEAGNESDPFKVDIWALAVVILRACKVSNPLSVQPKTQTSIDSIASS